MAKYNANTNVLLLVLIVVDHARAQLTSNRVVVNIVAYVFVVGAVCHYRSLDCCRLDRCAQLSTQSNNERVNACVCVCVYVRKSGVAHILIAHIGLLRHSNIRMLWMCFQKD